MSAANQRYQTHRRLEQFAVRTVRLILGLGLKRRLLVPRLRLAAAKVLAQRVGQPLGPFVSLGHDRRIDIGAPGLQAALTITPPIPHSAASPHAHIGGRGDAAVAQW